MSNLINTVISSVFTTELSFTFLCLFLPFLLGYIKNQSCSNFIKKSTFVVSQQKIYVQEKHGFCFFLKTSYP